MMFKRQCEFLDIMTRQTINKFLDDLTKKENINMIQLSKRLNIGKSTLYDFKRDGLENISLKLLDTLASYTNTEPSILLYNLASCDRYLSIHSGVNEASLMRLCQLFVEGYDIEINKRTTLRNADNVKKINAAGIAYNPKKSNIRIIEDWEELKRSYMLSIFGDVEYFCDKSIINNIFTSERDFILKASTFGLTYSSIGINSMIDFKLISEKRYNYELVFSDKEEMDRVKKVLSENIHAFNIIYTYIDNKKTEEFNYLCKDIFFEFELFYYILFINHTYIKSGITEDTPFSESVKESRDLHDIIKILQLFFDHFKKATKQALNVSEISANDSIYKTQHNADSIVINIINTISRLMNKGINPNETLINAIENIKPSFNGFYFIYSLFFCTLPYLDRINALKIIEGLKVFVDYFKESPLRRKYIQILSQNRILNLQNRTPNTNVLEKEREITSYFEKLSFCVQTGKVDWKATKKAFYPQEISYSNMPLISQRIIRNDKEIIEEFNSLLTLYLEHIKEFDIIL